MQDMGVKIISFVRNKIFFKYFFHIPSHITYIVYHKNTKKSIRYGLIFYQCENYLCAALYLAMAALVIGPRKPVLGTVAGKNPSVRNSVCNRFTALFR